MKSVLKAMPQATLQFLNNTLLKEWTAIAILSFAMSVFTIIINLVQLYSGIYSSLWNDHETVKREIKQKDKYPVGTTLVASDVEQMEFLKYLNEHARGQPKFLYLDFKNFDDLFKYEANSIIEAFKNLWGLELVKMSGIYFKNQNYKNNFIGIIKHLQGQPEVDTIKFQLPDRE